MTRKYKPKWDNRKVVDWKKIKNMNNKLLLEEVKDSCEDEGTIYSFYAESVVVNKVKSLLSLAHEIGRANRELNNKKVIKNSEIYYGALDKEK